MLIGTDVNVLVVDVWYLGLFGVLGQYTLCCNQYLDFCLHV